MWRLFKAIPFVPEARDWRTLLCEVILPGPAAGIFRRTLTPNAVLLPPSAALLPLSADLLLPNAALLLPSAALFTASTILLPSSSSSLTGPLVANVRNYRFGAVEVSQEARFRCFLRAASCICNGPLARRSQS